MSPPPRTSLPRLPRGGVPIVAIVLRSMDGAIACPASDHDGGGKYEGHYGYALHVP